MLVCWFVIVAAFVQEMNGIREGQEPVSESARNINLIVLLRGDCLWVTQLVVKTAQCPLDRMRIVVLNEGIRDPEGGELRFVIRFDEEAARVAMDDRSQLNHAWKGCLDSLH